MPLAGHSGTEFSTLCPVLTAGFLGSVQKCLSFFPRFWDSSTKQLVPTLEEEGGKVQRISSEDTMSNSTKGTPSSQLIVPGFWPVDLQI